MKGKSMQYFQQSRRKYWTEIHSIHGEKLAKENLGCKWAEKTDLFGDEKKFDFDGRGSVQYYCLSTVYKV